MNLLKLTRLLRPPLLSVVIPTYNRTRELSLCLEGFAQQTIPREKFEVIVVDDGSAEDTSSVCQAFRDRLRLEFIRQENSGPSVARNTAIRKARAQMLLLYDDDLRPVPDVVERCIEFHRLFPQEGDMMLLYFTPEPEHLTDPLTRWAFPRLYPFPGQACIEDWKKFWSGTTTCKKALFRRAQYGPKYLSLEDTEIGIRLSCEMDLRVHFGKRLSGVMTRQLKLKQVFSRFYSSGYYLHRLMQDYPTYTAGIPDYETGLIGDRSRLAALVASAQGLAKGAPNPQRYQMLSAIWTRAEVHARAEGWLAARKNQPFDPPGSIGAFLQE